MSWILAENMKLLGQRQWTIIIHSSNSSQSTAFAPVPYGPIPTELYNEIQMMLHLQRAVLQERNSEFREQDYIIMGSKHAWTGENTFFILQDDKQICLLSLEGNTVSSKAFCCTNILENIVWKKVVGGSTPTMCKNSGEPRTVLQWIQCTDIQDGFLNYFSVIKLNLALAFFFFFKLWKS